MNLFRLIVKVIKEDHFPCIGWLLLAFDLHFDTYGGFGGTAKVNDSGKFCLQAHPAVNHHCLSEFEVFDTVIDLHF